MPDFKSKLKPLPSHLPNEKLYGSIGARDPRTTDVRPDREDPFSSPDFLQSVLDFAADPANMGPGGAEHAVAAGGPDMIKPLKEAGKKMVRGVVTKGLSRRILNRPEVDAATSVLNKDATEGLRFAQRRYPRVMGHIINTGDIDEVTKFTNPHLNVRGQSSAVSMPTVMALEAPGTTKEFGADAAVKTARKLSDKVGVMGLNPTEATAETVGHELLHTGDRITMPDFERGYDASMKLPAVKTGEGRVIQPYEGSSYELRAGNMGDVLRRDLDAYRTTDPKAPWSVRLRQLKDKVRGK